MNNDNLYFILGGDRREESDAIAKHLDKKNIPYDIISNNLDDYALKEMIDEAIKKEKFPVLVEFDYSLDIPSNAAEIKQDGEIRNLYDRESALCQVLKMANIDLDMDIVYEACEGRGISEIYLPMHQEKYSLSNGLVITLERKIIDTAQFSSNEKLLKNVNSLPSENEHLAYPLYATYRSAFIEDKNGKKVKLFPNEEDKKRGTASFVVCIEGDKITKLGIDNNGFLSEVISKSDISAIYSQGHIVVKEKQAIETMTYKKSFVYTENETVDGQIVQKKTLNDKQIVELAANVKNEKNNVSVKLEEARQKARNKKLSGTVVADKIAEDMISGKEKRTITREVGKELSDKIKKEYALSKKQKE